MEKPNFRLNITNNDETKEFIADQDNSELYRHIGSLAIYNHAYFDLGDNLCTRIWVHDASYPQVEKYMLANDFVSHDNLRKVNPNDQEAYDKMIERQTGDLDDMPEDWRE